MLIYNYHAVTGVFTGSGEALPDPMELELAREAVFAPLAADAFAARQAAAAVALSVFEQATSSDDQTTEGFEEARAVFELATAALLQTYEAALSQARLQASLVKPQHWLIPANATTLPPPAFDFNELAVFRDGGWTVQQDVDGDGAPDVEPVADLAPAVRSDRTRRINAVRWLIDRHRDELALGRGATLTAEDYLVVLQYVQDLRDVPEQDGFPALVQWPELDPALTQTGA
ncbi:MAG: hypothetical protein EON96_01155 [Caulobacteraceae bacterium]|nr:MAG: hypothetical protein EON96_01155 [Caulobacteraceae bacterium]